MIEIAKNAMNNTHARMILVSSVMTGISASQQASKCVSSIRICGLAALCGILVGAFLVGFVDLVVGGLTSLLVVSCHG